MDTPKEPYARTYGVAMTLFALCWLISFYKPDAIIGAIALICLPLLALIAILQSPAYQSLMFKALGCALGIGLIVTFLNNSMTGPFIIVDAFVVAFIAAVVTKITIERRQDALLKQ